MVSTFFIIMLVASLVLFTVTRLATERLIHHHYEQKSDFFAHYPVKPGDIIFLGDSITDGARWDEIFPQLPVKNRGINADTTIGVLDRLGEITAGHPVAVFILIGTNDLPWYMYRSDKAILSTYEAILQRFKTETPQTKVFIQSILPRAGLYARRIQRLNANLEDLAKRSGYTFINLHPHFADRKGRLQSDITNDNIHLLAVGYERWSRLIKPYLEQFQPKA